jgi:hypothetical protein
MMSKYLDSWTSFLILYGAKSLHKTTTGTTTASIKDLSEQQIWDGSKSDMAVFGGGMFQL